VTIRLMLAKSQLIELFWTKL